MKLEVKHSLDPLLMSALRTLINIEEAKLAAIDDIRTKAIEINASLDNVQADVNVLLSQANDGGLTSAETSEVVNLVNSIGDKAAAIASIVP